MKNNLLMYVKDEIIEYDIKSCNISILSNSNMISPEDYYKIDKMPKKQRVIHIGNLIKYDRNNQIYQVLKSEIDKRVNTFIQVNELDEFLDIMLRVNDAIYTYRTCDTTMIDGVEFVEKNRYTSCIKLANAITFLYDSTSDTLDVKGINDKKMVLHKAMLTQIKKFMRLKELNRTEALYNAMHDFIEKYKNRELPISFYRDLSPSGTFVLDYSKYFVTKLDDEPLSSDKSLININFNYYNIITKIRDVLLRS
jgi:hypothetical protein